MNVNHPPALRPYHHGDLRHALLEAALAALARDSRATFTLRSLARDAGVSHNAPYAHFADKTALLAALAELGFADLTERLQAAADSTYHAGGDAAAAFVSVGAAYVRFGLENPAHYRLMFNAPELTQVEPDLAAAHCGPTAFGVLLDVLKRLYVEQLVSSQAVASLSSAASHEALAAFALAHGLASLLLDQRAAVAVGPTAPTPADTDHIVRAAFTLLLPGLRPAVTGTASSAPGSVTEAVRTRDSRCRSARGK